MDLGILYPVFAGVAALLILAPGPRRDVWRYLRDLATTVRDDMRSFLGWRRPRPLPAFDEADLLYTLPSEWIRQAEEKFDLAHRHGRQISEAIEAMRSFGGAAMPSNVV